MIERRREKERERERDYKKSEKNGVNIYPNYIIHLDSRVRADLIN